LAVYLQNIRNTSLVDYVDSQQLGQVEAINFFGGIHFLKSRIVLYFLGKPLIVSLSTDI